MHKGVLKTMKKLTAAVLATVAALSLGACNTPEDRALGGAGLGALTGAIVGASTAPRCPYGTYRDAYGNIYCR
jgi:osmotically inducible lipoprotein OsmB